MGQAASNGGELVAATYHGALVAAGGAVRLGASQTVGTYVMPALLAAFRQAFLAFSSDVMLNRVTFATMTCHVMS